MQEEHRDMLNTHRIVSMLRLQRGEGEGVALECRSNMSSGTPCSASFSMRTLETRKLVWVLADLAHMCPKRGVTQERQVRVVDLVSRSFPCRIIGLLFGGSGSNPEKRCR